MTPRIICLLFALLLAGSHTGWAQIYRYRAPDGSWIMSDRPPADDTEGVVEDPEGGGPSFRTTVKTPTRPSRGSANKHDVRKQARRRKRRRYTETPRAVDTHKFGLLTIGTPKGEVLRKLGPPADRVREGKKERMVRSNGLYVKRKVSIETWYYPGSNRLRPTRLVFYDNLLGEKDKGGY